MDKKMITSDTLILKLKLQSKLLAKSLNLPENFGDDLLATAIYQHFDFNELCESVSEFEYVLSFESLSEYQKLKYLFICEIEDKKLIEDLHIEIEKMALRLEERTVINISKLDLISNVYKLFGLENESRFIIDAEDIKLKWQPHFDSLQDHQTVLRTDLLINEIPFRLIATKFLFDEYSVNNLKHSLNTNLVQTYVSSAKNQKEKNQINEHSSWLVDSINCLLDIESGIPDQLPIFFKINNQDYFVYGFPLSPHLSISADDKCKNIHIQIKDTKEKQVFILNIGCERLVLECIFISKEEEGEYSFSQKNQWIKDALLSRDDACRFPIVFNNAYYLMFLRPFAHVDWLENAL
jgi:hypothetical protein